MHMARSNKFLTKLRLNEQGTKLKKCKYNHDNTVSTVVLVLFFFFPYHKNDYFQQCLHHKPSHTFTLDKRPRWLADVIPYSLTT